MASEAKFSVIFPAATISQSKVAAFEETARKNGISVNLPLRNDARGNLVLASGLSLRDAQMLRRQISSYGFNADVLSDLVNAPKPEPEPEQNSYTGGTLVVDLQRPEFLKKESASDDKPTRDWNLPSVETEDDGLSFGDIFDVEDVTWSGEPQPDSDASSTQTLSVNAEDLFRAAQSKPSLDDDDVDESQEIREIKEIQKTPSKPLSLLDSLKNGSNHGDKPTVNLAADLDEYGSETDMELSVNDDTGDAKEPSNEVSPESEQPASEDLGGEDENLSGEVAKAEEPESTDNAKPVQKKNRLVWIGVGVAIIVVIAVVCGLMFWGNLFK